MKFELVSPVGFIAKGVEAKYLTSAPKHVFCIPSNLPIEARRHSVSFSLCLSARAEVDNGERDRSEHRNDCTKRPTKNGWG